MNDDLPEGWSCVKFGALLTDAQNGCGVRQGTGQPTVVLRLADVSTSGTVATQGLRSIPLSAEAQRKYALAVGDLIAFRVNGSAHIAGQIITYPGPAGAAYCDHFIRFRIEQHVALSRFVSLAFRTPVVRNQVEEKMVSSAGQNTVSQASFREIQIPLPPIAEQRRIVAQVEALLAKVLSSKERLDKIPRILKRFRQSVLSAACNGKLTADWREEHPAVGKVRLDSCERLRREKVSEANAMAGRSRFRYAPAAQIDIGDRTKGIDELFELPETWSWASLGQLTWAVADGPHFSPKYVGPEQGVPFISGRNISYEGIDFSDAKYVSPEDHAEFTKRTQPEMGDVLLTKGGTTGIATVVTTEREFSVWVHVAVLKVVDELVDPFYLRDALSTPFAYVQSQAQTHGVGNQDLGLTRMVHIALPLPPIAEQVEIVRRIQAAFKVADRLEARYNKATTLVDRLTQSVLAQAFRGELVVTEAELARREGRSYETAEELLARIRGCQQSGGSMRDTRSAGRKKRSRG